MASKFKHKEINFDERISMENYFLLNVQDNYPRLKDIFDGKISYVPSDYPTLINTFEQMYKGFCKELQVNNFNNTINLSESSYAVGHRFAQFYVLVNDTIPLSENREQHIKIKENISKLEQSYNSGRYMYRASFDEFQKDYIRFENQLYKLTQGLTKEFNKKFENDINIENEFY